MPDCTINVRGPWASVTASLPVLASISDLLSAEKPGARFSYAYKTHRWDGIVRLLRARSFPAGLTQRVAEHLRTAGLAVDVSLPLAPVGNTICAALLNAEVRDYQLAGAEHAITVRRCLLESPTGSGKTETGAEIIRRLGLPTLWLTHRADLASQTRQRLSQRLGIPIGFIGGGQWELGLVTVGMVQTLARAFAKKNPPPDAEIHRITAYLQTVRVLLLDEAHHGSADTWVTVGNQCANAEYRIGLSGTLPERDPLSTLVLEGVCGPKHVVADVTDLAARGFLATPTVRLIEPPKASYRTYEQIREEVLPTWRVDSRPLQRLGTKLFDLTRRYNIVGNDIRTRAFADAALTHYRAGEKVLILCELVAHARRFERMLRSLGAERLWCLTGEDKDREAATARFKTFDPPGLLIATPWFREGMDVPEVDVGFLAGASMSEVAILQGFGRMLRPRPDKTSVLVYAALDGRDPREDKDYFAQHSVAQLRIFRERGWRILRQAEWLEPATAIAA